MDENVIYFVQEREDEEKGRREKKLPQNGS